MTRIMRMHEQSCWGRGTTASRTAPMSVPVVATSSPARAHRALRIAHLALLGSALTLLSACSLHPRTPAPSHVVFFDDFAGDSLDRTKWNVRVTGRTVNEEEQAYVDDTATIRVVKGPLAGGADGALLIRGRWRPGHVTPEGKRHDFVSGRMDSRGKVEFMYGTAAARMRLPAGAGLWPAFWLLGAGRWPDVGEIDVMENVGDRSWTSVAVHGPGYSGDTPLVMRASFPPGQDITGWHVYSVDWTPDLMIFRVDDREIYRVTQAMVARYGRWAFDNPKFLIVNLALGGGYPRSVNGAKGPPYVGLPDSTVQLIRRGEAAVLVDWIRVTQPGR